MAADFFAHRSLGRLLLAEPLLSRKSSGRRAFWLGRAGFRIVVKANIDVLLLRTEVVDLLGRHPGLARVSFCGGGSAQQIRVGPLPKVAAALNHNATTAQVHRLVAPANLRTLLGANLLWQRPLTCLQGGGVQGWRGATARVLTGFYWHRIGADASGARVGALLPAGRLARGPPFSLRCLLLVIGDSLDLEVAGAVPCGRGGSLRFGRRERWAAIAGHIH